MLVVNTASFCGFTRQYRDMQALYDEFGDDGLVVLAVPSEDFNQEYSDNDDVAQFCRVETGLTFPIAEITLCAGQMRTRSIAGWRRNTANRRTGISTRR